MIPPDPRFVKLLLELGVEAPGPETRPEVDARLHRTFVDQNWATQDNVSAMEHIGWIDVDTTGDPATRGIGVTAKKLLVSTVFWEALESEAGAQLILNAFPQLDKAEAKAILRVCTVILGNLESADQTDD